jgi:pilus assembly protein TadC
VTGLAVVLLGLSVAMAIGRDAGGAQRLGRLTPTLPRQRPVLSASTACVLAGAALTVVAGLPEGALLGLVVAVAGPMALGRLEPASVRQEREALIRELPLLLDLLAACLAGGAALVSAAAAVSGALPGPCGRRLSVVVDTLAVGSPPGDAWLALAGGSTDDPLAPAARLLARAAEGGTPVSTAVTRLAADARAASLAAGSEAARRVGVLVVAPLGVCFLPAFVLLGIVPVVAGLAAPLFRTV